MGHSAFYYLSYPPPTSTTTHTPPILPLSNSGSSRREAQHNALRSIPRMPLDSGTQHAQEPSRRGIPEEEKKQEKWERNVLSNESSNLSNRGGWWNEHAGGGGDSACFQWASLNTGLLQLSAFQEPKPAQAQGYCRAQLVQQEGSCSAEPAQSNIQDTL